MGFFGRQTLMNNVFGYSHCADGPVECMLSSEIWESDRRVQKTKLPHSPNVCNNKLSRRNSSLRYEVTATANFFYLTCVHASETVCGSRRAFVAVVVAVGLYCAADRGRGEQAETFFVGSLCLAAHVTLCIINSPDVSVSFFLSAVQISNTVW